MWLVASMVYTKALVSPAAAVLPNSVVTRKPINTVCQVMIVTAIVDPSSDIEFLKVILGLLL